MKYIALLFIVLIIKDIYLKSIGDNITLKKSEDDNELIIKNYPGG